MDYIKKIVLALSKFDRDRRDPDRVEERQLHLWDDLDQVISLHRRDGGANGIELGDFGLAEIEARTQQIKANLKEVTDSKEIWERACEYICAALARKLWLGLA